MAVADRILEPVQRAAGPICDDCLSCRAVLSSRQQANAEARLLAQQGKVSRDRATCSVCGGQKLVNWPKSGVVGRTVPTTGGVPAIPKPSGTRQSNRQASPPNPITTTASDQTLKALGYPFNHVGPIDPDRNASGEVKHFSPHLEYTQAATATLHKYGAGPFCRFRVPAHLTQEGVYLITHGQQVLYAGKCDNLAVRFNMGYGQISPRNCYQGGQSTNCKVNHLILAEIEQGRTLDLWFYPTANPLSVEGQLIAGLDPPWNGRL
jgi:hypothetical protein